MSFKKKLFEGLKGAKSWISSGLNFSGKRAYKAYEAKEYDKMVQILQKQGPKQFLEITQANMTLLHHACFDKNLEAVAALSTLPYFKDIVNDDSNEFKWTPLLWAAVKGDSSIVKFLHENGAELFKPKQDGMNIMHIAATQGDVRLLDYAIKNKTTATIDIPNEEGWTPAHLAAFGGNMDCLNLLIDNGTDLSFRHKHNMNSIHEIIRNDNSDFLSCIYPIIKDKKRDMREVGTYGLLHIAASTDGGKCMLYLLEQGEYINQICNEKDKATPLHFAVLSGMYVNAKILLKYGANPNAQDSLGNTPIHFAVIGKNLSMVRLLEENNAKADLKNDEGMTAIDYAITENIKDIKLFFMSNSKYANYDFVARTE